MGKRFLTGSGLVAISVGLMGCGTDSGRGSMFGVGGSGGIGVGAGGVGNTGGIGIGGNGATGGGGPGGDPVTCEDAALTASYVGCEFWPTVSTNGVWEVFDFAVIVANASGVPVDVAIDRGGTPVTNGTVAPNSLEKFYLPWVPELKGLPADPCGATPFATGSVRSPQGAYHLTSTAPVTVYQFNALEYQGQGGPPGKDWSSCPGLSACIPQDPLQPPIPAGIGCFSFSNDASLLLPTPALTTNYRVTSQTNVGAGEFVTITGTVDNTQVTVTTGPSGRIQQGTDTPFTGANGQLQFLLNRGEVMQLLSENQSILSPTPADLSGSLINTSAPVQVVAGQRCIQQPADAPACDHIEESVFPAETLGDHYFVTSPTGVDGRQVGHIVRIYGNFDGTTLQYPAGMPPGAPTTINASQVVDLGVVLDDFEIIGDNSFAVGSFMLGGTIQDPGATGRGDPSQSQMIAVDQYRTKYVFLAPDDYDQNWVDIVQPVGATVTLDGNVIGPPTPIGGSGFGTARVGLGPGNNGAHVLTSTEPVGIQVVGFGNFTSYQFPGGSDLRAIAPPPVR